jgi:hypothetical protein
LEDDERIKAEVDLRWKDMEGLRKRLEKEEREKLKQLQSERKKVSERLEKIKAQESDRKAVRSSLYPNFLFVKFTLEQEEKKLQELRHEAELEQKRLQEIEEERKHAEESLKREEELMRDEEQKAIHSHVFHRDLLSRKSI